ncbi:membrane protein insertion efficiency factor YidD [[Mycobacterium] kokjensenii]|uniref:Putative membrane protein insertion efficiency factor n=1 Tax=[Mycobacterium] kokjensenii TaxID=3064287 RepID=A0ABN9NLH1_9MYCO|nr:membrane protein insertion efficiency factor YidD [Mycolicibacter sp. MU0083]CAJ1506597.1 membrane protein insertion efficiency factor YidD [Mycolicibacter sp. MU0083]
MTMVASRPARALIFVIQLYRTMISPLRLPSCRFMPTCSRYAVDALGEYGLIRGGWLAAVRLAKCGPWHQGGWDPIPERSPGTAVCGCPSGNAPDKRAEGDDRVF